MSAKALLLLGTLLTLVTSVTQCGFSTTETFKNYVETVDSNAPVLFPKNEAELSQLLGIAKSNGCKVRVRGAGHSANGVVIQRTEEKVVVVSLRDFVNVAGWTNSINTTSGVATISAGATTFDLMRMARPLGWLMFQQTAGYFGTIGGIISNTATGGVVGSGFVYDSVVALRVMNGNGVASNITGTALRNYLGAFGLPSIILSVRIQLRKDDGAISVVEHYKYTMASVDPSWAVDLTKDQAALLATQRYIHCILNPWPNMDGQHEVSCLLSKSAGVAFPTDPVTAATYDAVYTAMSQVPAFQGLNYQGGPVLRDLSSLVNLCDAAYLGPVNCKIKSAVSAAVSTFIVSTMVSQFETNANLTAGGTQDLYWIAGATLFREVSYFVPVPRIAEAIAAYIEVTLPLVANPLGSFFPLGFLTFRPFLPTGASAWETVTAGVPYYQIEISQLLFDDITTEEDLKAVGDLMAQLESKWKGLGGVSHQGKGWGYGKRDIWWNGENNAEFLEPYNRYATSQANTLRSVIDSQFEAGSQVWQLKPDSYVPFEPRTLNDRECKTDDVCISGYCDNTDTCVDPPSNPPGGASSFGVSLLVVVVSASIFFVL